MIQGNNGGESLCAKPENFEQVMVETKVVFASPYGLGPSVGFTFMFHGCTIINGVCIGRRSREVDMMLDTPILSFEALGRVKIECGSHLR